MADDAEKSGAAPTREDGLGSFEAVALGCLLTELDTAETFAIYDDGPANSGVP
jgi:hypothetical protein